MLSSAPPPPPDRPEPIYACWYDFFGSKYCEIQFDELIVPGGTPSIGNWFVVIGGYSWAPNNVQILAAKVQLRLIRGIPIPGPDRVTYFAVPEDVRAVDDNMPALPFADFLMA